MQRKVYLTRLRPERRDEYIQAHQDVSSDLMRRYRDAGMELCAVYILEDQLVLIIDAADHEKTRAILENDPMDREWQSYVGPMKVQEDWQEMQQLFYKDWK